MARGQQPPKQVNEPSAQSDSLARREQEERDYVRSQHAFAESYHRGQLRMEFHQLTQVQKSCLRSDYPGVYPMGDATTGRSNQESPHTTSQETVLDPQTQSSQNLPRSAVDHGGSSNAEREIVNSTSPNHATDAVSATIGGHVDNLNATAEAQQTHLTAQTDGVSVKTLRYKIAKMRKAVRKKEVALEDDRRLWACLDHDAFWRQDCYRDMAAHDLEDFNRTYPGDGESLLPNDEQAEPYDQNEGHTSDTQATQPPATETTQPTIHGNSEFEERRGRSKRRRRKKRSRAEFLEDQTADASDDDLP
ncbi:MAG: hypothetical protein Q9218_003123 [Villophora microphyllina]